MSLGREIDAVFLIADLVGYTALTEAMGGGEAVKVIDRYVKLAETALARDVRIVERVGDELLVVAAEHLAGARARSAYEAHTGVPAAGEARAAYTGPMHPEVRQQGPGACPDCGMALEPALLTSPVTKTEYVCPMHPEIVRDKPGACPVLRQNRTQHARRRCVCVSRQAEPQYARG